MSPGRRRALSRPRWSEAWPQLSRWVPQIPSIKNKRVSVQKCSHGLCAIPARVEVSQRTDFPAGIVIVIGGETESTSYENRHRQPVHRIAMARHAAVSEPSARWPCLKKWLGQEIVISISLCALGINGVNADAASGANATATAPVVPSGPDVPAYVSDE